MMVRGAAGRLHANLHSTYSLPVVEQLARRFDFLDRHCLDRIQHHSPGHADLVKRQAEDFLTHRFDLLGSGPVVVAHGISCLGLEGRRFEPGQPVSADEHGAWLEGRINPRNLRQAQRIWRCVGKGYRPIDWQLDFKSGFRWSERVWHRDIRFGQHRGADVKVPWELARMQHLPVLALAACYAVAGFEGFRPVHEYGQEVRSQILDFVSTNPPGFGVNWYCSMDAGIRVANMLVARDMLHCAGFEFDVQADGFFSGSIRSHARHIAANLEWAPKFRGNHYLADIAGLLFCAAYLPSDKESDLWLHFAATELLGEIEYQFHPDGSNFEGSVCYHRLSAEIVLWALAALEGLAPARQARCDAIRRWPGTVPPRRVLPPLPLHEVAGTDIRSLVPPWCRGRMAAMAEFTRALTRPDGLVTQFGDNDSGRFMTLGGGEQLRAGGDAQDPAWTLDHGGFVAAAQAFVGAEARDAGAELLAGFARVQPYWEDTPAARGGIGDSSVWHEVHVLASGCPPGSRYRSEFPASPGFLEELQLRHFSGMGCYIFRSPRFYLAVRCGEIGIAGLGAHAHCDQLGIELVLDGQDRVRDPGTYVYTALPERRNAYRSANAHHVPRCGGREPGDLQQGAFDLRGLAEGECLYFGPLGFIGRHAGYGEWIYRSIALEQDRITVLDFCPLGIPVTDPSPAPLPFSQGYGQLISGT